MLEIYGYGTIPNTSSIMSQAIFTLSHLYAIVDRYRLILTVCLCIEMMYYRNKSVFLTQVSEM